MKRSIVAGVVAVLALGLVGGPVAADTEPATYSPPYENGPSGGASISQVRRDPDGRVVIARVNPVPGPIQCAGGGAFAKFNVAHTLTGPISTVRAAFTEGATDGYVFAVLSVRDPQGEWLGSTQLRGPLISDGQLELGIDPALFESIDGEDPELQPGDVLTIQFGLEMASACPHVNGGTVRFTEITVT